MSRPAVTRSRSTRPAAYAQSKQAKYVVQRERRDQRSSIDQTAVDGWQSLGEFDFAAGGDSRFTSADNTGELLADKVQLVFDAVASRASSTDGDGAIGETDRAGDRRRL